MRVPSWASELAVVAGELAFGSSCAGCGKRAGGLCTSCRMALDGPAWLVPDGSAACGLPVLTAAEYAGPVRAAIVAHKERGRLSLYRPLGAGLAVAAAGVLERPDGCLWCGRRPVVLVPVPSSRRSVRHRGHDPLLRAARYSAELLRRVGYEVTVVPGLRQRRRVADQSGLGRGQRTTNLAGAFTLRTRVESLLVGRCVVVVDDVVTTGSTLTEAARALSRGGTVPCGAAVMAATARTRVHDRTAYRFVESAAREALRS